mmetsp:Transcript_13182/g.17953  ORF Transcript_13182/g.17953 Transcript_13182/m.17953 type:complete len:144 (-) Transcript_13182:179-610(-)|eukprot:CAMPEP_0201481928 /NCGR_PEP_ID=MMETSP0151_2-20130828/6182_1 /ASSEMBLY_ACC=CAM_ASM_000257 /TAXON_ID=200890 /ORGANISM="Paramoeba atlantica, Strain 621/1 / CCAP 1560/9" /LENGTH=143 /DNA_ID=CAMNT_0047864343 /DNA_START=121 /DNA_END=552 /DNA_ORIENTATION=+
MTAILFEDMFVVEAKDAQGKPFDLVSRFDCQGENYEMSLTIDINTDIYPMKKSDKFTLALATSLQPDGTLDDGTYNPHITQSETLLEKYEYVMYGKVFKFEQFSDRLAICASFGGLLMELVGDPRNLHGICLDQNLYLLIRRA